MSTKCYYGIRFPISKLSTFVSTMRPARMTAIYKYADNLVSQVDVESKIYLTQVLQHQASVKKKHAKKCRKCCVSIVMRSLREGQGPFASTRLDCGYNLWLPAQGRFVIAHPWGSNISDPQNVPEWIEEYCYWDNVDRPECISTREWNRRSKVWETALRNERCKLQLVCFDNSKHSVDMCALSLYLYSNGKSCYPPS